MLVESFEGKLKAKTVSIIDRKNAFGYLNSKYSNKVSKIKFGYLYRINYKSDDVFYPNKIVIPLSIEDGYLICFDILFLHPDIRAKLFDFLSTGNDIMLDNKQFKKLSSSVVIKRSIKKFIIKNINSFEKVSFDNIEQILFI